MYYQTYCWSLIFFDMKNGIIALIPSKNNNISLPLNAAIKHGQNAWNKYFKTLKSKWQQMNEERTEFEIHCISREFKLRTKPKHTKKRPPGEAIYFWFKKQEKRLLIFKDRERKFPIYPFFSFSFLHFLTSQPPSNPRAPI